MWGSHLVSQAYPNQWGCRHVAVPMSGGGATLADRKANCTSQADRDYPWYDLIYLGNGIGWGLDNRHIQRHFCLEKGLNFSSTERQIGTVRYDNQTASGSNSANVYEIASNPTKFRNTSDPGNKFRLAVVDNPFRSGGSCFLHRIRSLDPPASTRRSAVRQSGGTPSKGWNQQTADCMPRGREIWFAGAYLYGDSASWDEGEAESWAGANTSGAAREVFGFQVHNDNGDAASVISGTGTMEEPPSPSLASFMRWTNGGAESTPRLEIRRARPAVQGQRLRNMFISDAQSGASGATNTGADSLLWTSPDASWLHTKWIGFVVRTIWSWQSDGVIQVWHNALDTTFNSTPIVDVSGWNDYDVGPLGVGFYSNASGKRNNPQNVRGDQYHCPAEIYSAHTMQLASMTMRSIPVRTHDRNPARTPAEYAGDLMALLKWCAYGT
jgi:hypothetical protein